MDTRQKTPLEVHSTITTAGLTADWISILKTQDPREARSIVGPKIYKGIVDQIRSKKRADNFDATLESLRPSPAEVDKIVKSFPDEGQFLGHDTSIITNPRQRIVFIDAKIIFLNNKRLVLDQKIASQRASIKIKIKGKDDEIKKKKNEYEKTLRANDKESKEVEKIQKELSELGEEKKLIQESEKKLVADVDEEKKELAQKIADASKELPSAYNHAHEKGMFSDLFYGRLLFSRKKYVPVNDDSPRMQQVREIEFYRQRYEMGIDSRAGFIRKIFEIGVKPLGEKVSPEEIFLSKIEALYKADGDTQREGALGELKLSFKRIIKKRFPEFTLLCNENQSSQEVQDTISKKIEECAFLYYQFKNNPFIVGVHLGDEQLLEEVISHLLYPHYKLDMIIGYGGSTDPVNVRIPAYVLAPLTVIEKCLERGIRPPKLRILNAYALAVEINRMREQKTRATALRTDKLLREFIKEFFPRIHEMNLVESQIPNLGELQDGPVTEDARKIDDYYRRLDEEFGHYAVKSTQEKEIWRSERIKQFGKDREVRKKWEKRFNVWRALEGLVERGVIRFKDALEKQGMSKEGLITRPTEEEREEIMLKSFTYIAAHPWAFDNFASMVLPHEKIPNGIIKFGGTGEENFNELQAFLVDSHYPEDSYDVLWAPTNSSGMAQIPGSNVSERIDPVSLERITTVNTTATVIAITNESGKPPYYEARVGGKSHEVSIDNAQKYSSFAQLAKEYDLTGKTGEDSGQKDIQMLVRYAALNPLENFGDRYLAFLKNFAEANPLSSFIKRR